MSSKRVVGVVESTDRGRGKERVGFLIGEVNVKDTDAVMNVEEVLKE